MTQLKNWMVATWLFALATLANPLWSQSRESDYLRQVWSRYRVIYCPEDADVIESFCSELDARLPGVERLFGLTIGDTVAFVITPTEAEWRRVTAGAPLWANGIAYPSRGTAILKSPRFGLPYGPLPRTAVHEYVHLLLETGAPSSKYPRWFNEGVAQLAAGQLDYLDQTRIARAAASGRLHSFSQIEMLMGMPDTDARVAYAESVIAAQLLQAQYGWSLISNLVSAVRNGQEFEITFSRLTGRSLVTFEQEYISHLRSTYAVTLLGDTELWFSAAVMLLLVGAGFALWLRRKRTLRRWQDEEWGRTDESISVAPPYTVNYEIIRNRGESQSEEDAGESTPKSPGG